jgi:hypothetical protein
MEGWPAAASSSSSFSSAQQQQRQLRKKQRAIARAAARRVYQSRVATDYPLAQISCPVHVWWGSEDHLPDTAWLLANLPSHATQRPLPYEHLDFLYARDALTQVYPDVIAQLAADARKAAAADAAGPELTAAATAPASAAGSSDPSSASSMFAEAVLRRDGHRCVRCRAGSPIPLSAVSLLPMAPTPQQPQLQSAASDASLLRAGLLHGLETCNGLTLCASCSGSFQRGEWSIDQDNARPIRYSSKSASVAGASVTARPVALTQPSDPALLAHWPTSAVLRERAAMLLRSTRRNSRGGDVEAEAGNVPSSPGTTAKQGFLSQQNTARTMQAEAIAR